MSAPTVTLTGTLDRVTTDFLKHVFSDPSAIGATLTADVSGAPAPMQRIGSP